MNETLTELLETLSEQANELIEFGDSREKANGRGMLLVIDAIIKELTENN